LIEGNIVEIMYFILENDIIRENDIVVVIRENDIVVEC
jgi:hypothetical protein